MLPELAWPFKGTPQPRLKAQIIMNTNIPALDVNFLRAQFPVFEHAEYGQWGYFENAGGSQAPRQVTDAMMQALSLTKVQPYYPYGPSEDLGASMDKATAFMDEMLNVGEGASIAFGPATTVNTYMMAQAMQSSLKSGDEIIVTNQEHEANAGAWHRMAAAVDGVVLKEWMVDPVTGRLDPADLEALLSDRTRLVAFTHCSNVVGEMNDAAAITAIARKSPARVVIDGVAYAPHRIPDFAAIGADAYLYSAYKTFATHQGVIAVTRDWLAELENQGHFFNGEYLEKRLIPSGPQHAEVSALNGLKEFYEDLYLHHFGSAPAESAAIWVSAVQDIFHAHEVAICAPLMDFLAEDKRIRLIGPRDFEFGKRAPTISFTVDGVKARDVTAKMAEAKIGASAGHYYAYRLMEALKIEPSEGVVRLSLVGYNTEDEVARCINAIKAVL